MKPTRIEYVIDHLKVGGAQRHLVELFSAMDRRRFAPQVCVAKGGGALIPVMERMGIQVRVFGLGSSLAEPRTIGALRRFATRLRADAVTIVHGYLYLGNIIGVLAGRLAGVPIRIAGKRSLDRYPRRAQLLMTRLANRGADRVLCNAEAVRRFVLEEERPDPNKLRVIPNGIRLPTRRATPMRPRQIPAGSRIVGTIGRLGWKKSYGDLLDAARRVATQRDDVHFVIVGDGPLRRDIETQATRLGIDDRVHLLGEVRDVRGLLAGFDVFVLSSIIEGMPNVLLEALGAERPAVVTRVGGMPEIVTNNETGLIVPPAAPDAMADAILRLLARTEEAHRLGIAGRRRVEERFSAETMAASYSALYEELLLARGLACPITASKTAPLSRAAG